METRPWKPEMAPQAMVTNSSGMIGGVPAGTFSFTAGATTVGFTRKIAAYSTSSPTKSCRPLM